MDRTPTQPSGGRAGRGTGRRHAPPAERRAQILGAALGCFAAKGYHAATMDDLVRASGLSKGSLYWHFSSKEDVFLALIDDVAAEMIGRFESAGLDGEGDVADVLVREIELFLEGLGQERQLLLAWAEFLGHPRGRERMAVIYRETRSKLAAILRRGVDDGSLRALPVEDVAAAVTGAADALVLQAVIDPDFDMAGPMRVLGDVIRGGIVRPSGGVAS